MVNLIVPIYSMRSHTDGQYHVMKDGNMQLHLSRYQPGDFLVIPNNTADVRELYKYVPAKQVFRIAYMENAYETRKKFWAYNGNIIDSLARMKGVDRIITDITGYKGTFPFINNFNISWDPQLDRPYIDEFVDMDYECIRHAKTTFVLNERQVQNMKMKFPDLTAAKFTLTQRVIKPELLDKMAEGDPIELEGTPERPLTMFFPFRLSDPAYKWEETIELYKDHTVYITDPNESYTGDYPNVVVIKPSKNEYYRILKARPVVRYNENPYFVFHPGLAEMIYFDVRFSLPPGIFLPFLKDLIIEGPIWPTSF
ncbi:hypothetical protein NCTGTJJY_CDS0036 [Serratia phage 92A1]|nr:hypothetical protein NCTGTJJY_CDS0036 [Serratia phage 92A1]